MANQLVVGIGADNSKLTADLARAQAQLSDFGKQLRDAAKSGDDEGVNRISKQYDDEFKNVAKLKTALKDARNAGNEDGEKTGGGGWLASAHAALGRIQTAMGPVKEGFADLHAKASAFGNALANTASSIFPHFKEVLALGTIGGAAGFLSMVESTASWAHNLKLTSQELGFSYTQLGSLKAAAVATGVDFDRLVAAAARFGANLQKAADEQKKAILDLSTLTSGKRQLADNGITVTRGGQGSPNDAIPVSRGGALPDGGAAGASAHFIKASANLDLYKDKLETLYNVSQKMGQAPAPDLQTWIADIGQKLNGTEGEALKTRQALAKIGIDLPAKTIEEMNERLKPGFSDPFTKMRISAFQANGEVRSLYDAFGDFAEKIKNTSSESERLSLVRQQLGRGFNDLIPILAKGRDNLDAVAKAMRAKGVDTTEFDKEIEKGDELYVSLRKLDGAMSGLRKSFILPFVDVFTPLVESLDNFLRSNKTQVTEFARGLAASIRPIAEDLGKLFKGEAPTKGGIVEYLVGLKKTAIDAITSIQAGFEKLMTAVNGIADTINAVFGTKLSGQMLLVGGAIFYLIGGFTVLTTGITLLSALISPAGAVLVGLGAMAVTLYKLPTIVSAVGRGFKAVGDAIEGAFKFLLGDTLGGIIGGIVTGPIKLMGDALQVVADIIRAIGAVLRGDFTQAWAEIQKAGQDWLTMWDNIGTAALGVIQRIGDGIAWLAKQAVAAASSISAALGLTGNSGASVPGVGGGSADLGGAAGPAIMQASGGYISGPGSGTSDSIPARLSNGEYVLRAASVAKIGVGALDRLNSAGYAMGGLVGRALGFSPSIPSFAGGGLVGAGAGGDTLNLSIGGQTFSGLKVPRRSTFDDLTSFSRTEQRTSAGAKPSWYGS